MNTLARVITMMLGSMVVHEGIQQLNELDERHKIFTQARECADSVGKPLLVVGAPSHQFSHPCGDITVDISPGKAAVCDGVIADIRDIPYPNHYFGAAFCSHVLEHLPTMQDACLALDELERVADYIFVVSPHKTSISAWLHPGHHLWIIPSGDGYIIEQRGTVKVPATPICYLVSMSVL